MATSDAKQRTRTTMVVFGAGLVLGAGLGVLLGGREAPGADATARAGWDDSSAVTTRIADRLDRLVEALTARARPVAAGPADEAAAAGGAVERVAVPADVGLDIRIAALEREVRRLRSRVDASAVADLAHGRRRAPRWEELRAVMDGLESGDGSRRTATRQQIMLRMPEQILEMFGAPTDVVMDQLGRMVWGYHDPSTGRGTSVTFVDGLAMVGW